MLASGVQAASRRVSASSHYAAFVAGGGGGGRAKRGVARGEHTRRAIAAQPDWLRGVAGRVRDRRLPAGRVVFTGCGTSFHAAQTGGEAIQALEAVLPPPPADLLVAVSHEGG